MEPSHLPWYNQKVKELLSETEIKDLHSFSNLKAILEISKIWLWIIASFALVYFYPNALTVVLAIIIIGAKQLGCAIIMHDAGHSSLFRTKRLNTFFGNWLGAYPIFLDVSRYGKYHLEHHKYTGLKNDPDTNLTKGYPATKISFTRKILRDLLGLSGIKGTYGFLLMHAEQLHFELGGRVMKNQHPPKGINAIITFVKNFTGPLSANLLIFLVCFLLGNPLLYLLWIGAFLTTFNFCIRIRSIAEHSVVEDKENPHKNTRTTYANFMEKLLFAPLNVNYHAEHHLMMSVPSYNLPKMHKLIKTRGYFEEGTLDENYLSILRKAIT